MLRGESKAATAQSLALQEGRLTQGVWLPLALAQLMQMLVCVVRMFASDETKPDVPKTSEVLKSFGLPAFAEAVASDEKVHEGKAAIDSLKAFATMSGGKFEMKEAK